MILNPKEFREKLLDNKDKYPQICFHYKKLMVAVTSNSIFLHSLVANDSKAYAILEDNGATLTVSAFKERYAKHDKDNIYTPAFELLKLLSD